MKKQITAFITAALILAGFTGCSTSTEPLSNPSDISGEISDPVSNNSAHDKNNVDSGNLSNTTNSSAESTISSSENINSGANEDPNPSSENHFPESFTGYLGETLYGTDASEQFSRSVMFDNFTYLRWATPVFDNTLKNPDLINWDTYDMPQYDDILRQKQKDPEWFLVKPGDVLENGLVVKSASCGFREANFYDGRKSVIQSKSEVVFENTLTLSGVLYCSPNDDAYITNGDLFFFADSTDTPNIPIINKSNGAGEYDLVRYVFSNAAFVCDGMYFRVGDIDSVSVDLSGIIKRGELCEVRVTLDNISLGHDDDGSIFSGAFADIVSIEKINN